MKKSVLVALAVAPLALFPRVAASPSGLNNIPTADTAPHLTLVLQEYSTFGAQRPPDHTAGFKFGIDPWKQSERKNRFETGYDGHFAPGTAGPGVFQVKYTTQPRAELPALSIGFANIAVDSGDRARVGQPFAYAVLSHELGFLRVHGGYGLQARGNDTLLLGVDRTFKLLDRDLVLRADAVQTDRQHNWAASVGGLYAICKYFVLESWVTEPIHRSPPAFTVKLDVVIPF